MLAGITFGEPGAPGPLRHLASSPELAILATAPVPAEHWLARAPVPAAEARLAMEPALADHWLARASGPAQDLAWATAYTSGRW